MSRILILANNDVGLYKFRKELIQELLNNGNEIYIALPFGDFVNPLVNMGCIYIDTPIDRRGINPVKDIKTIIKYFAILRKVNPNLLITYTIKPNIYGGIASRIKKVPYAINITGLGTAFQKDGLLKRAITFLYKLSCKKAKVVFFENEQNQTVFINNKIVEKEITYKLNGAGVNLEEFQFYKYPAGNAFHFLFVGRVMKEKGVDELFEAAKRIKKEYDNVAFDIVGPLEDDYKEKIEELVNLGIINFYGFQKDVKPFIEKANTLVLPSYHEGMSNTLLECGAMGRPLITSNIYGCKEAVIHGKNGYLVKVKDSEDLYKKMKAMIELPYEERVCMGKKSREHIEIFFDKKKVVSNTIRELGI